LEQTVIGHGDFPAFAHDVGMGWERPGKHRLFLNPGRLLGRLLIRLIAPSSITAIFDGVLVDAP
jgi:hypothetical protein